MTVDIVWNRPPWPHNSIRPGAPLELGYWNAIRARPVLSIVMCMVAPRSDAWSDI
jgi:hypothetical protein